MKIEYNKLIRDRIPEIIEESGLQYQTEMLTEEKYRDALFAKLIEEAQEVATAPPDSLVAELADLYEVIDTILEVYQPIFSHFITKRILPRHTRKWELDTRN